MKKILIITLGLLLIQCSSGKKSATGDGSGSEFSLDTITCFDQSRNRNIPVAIYQPKDKNVANNIPVIFSHGYGENKGGDYLLYSYLTEFLASKGYFVISIQHELPTDELLAMDGNLRETRLPNWERGVRNILFVLDRMKEGYPILEYENSVLIGHSNGGDMTVLFAHEYPDLVKKIISMDNRRMELPRTSNPRIFTLRSDDYPADEGVLPTDEESEKYGITIEYTDINHSNMDDDANTEERKYLTGKIWEYLKSN